ncbi:hypothetical protein P691DRAFT_53813 [Macrolepiota fuliginosa MF-IS2]|uniref:Uncharacterized protein n=1 Tax=Macrolepiota fuliginosa MF-IS2 TaxID=1400762 RepID=A0A9P6BWM3_9AGAR|nr:hypothetical protein P691DRAFT_53813 [Macrolepiota fuliginosa MF-IS2]
MQELEFVHKALVYYSNACIACSLQGPPGEASKHPFRDCQHHPSPTNKSDRYRQFRGALKFPVGTCYQCGIPQKLHYCNQHGEIIYLHEYTVDASQPCPYAEIPAAIAFSINEDPALRKKIGTRILSIRDPTLNISTWLSETELFGLHSNIIQLVLCSLS